tara:strand:- start:6 stop:332 length:327 start_codon:yes stop_codon:yes gene_type:complete
MTEIIDKSPEEVKSWIDSHDACLIDVREDHEIAQARIPNTDIHIPLSRFDPAFIPTNSEKKLVFICAQGVRSMQAGQYLLNNGTITEAYNLQGGIAEWHRSGLPLDMD